MPISYDLDDGIPILCGYYSFNLGEGSLPALVRIVMV